MQFETLLCFNNFHKISKKQQKNYRMLISINDMDKHVIIQIMNSKLPHNNHYSHQHYFNQKKKKKKKLIPKD